MGIAASTPLSPGQHAFLERCVRYGSARTRDKNEARMVTATLTTRGYVTYEAALLPNGTPSTVTLHVTPTPEGEALIKNHWAKLSVREGGGGLGSAGARQHHPLVPSGDTRRKS